MRDNSSLCKLVFPQRDGSRLKQRLQSSAEEGESGEEELKKIFREINRLVVRNLKLEQHRSGEKLAKEEDEAPKFCVFGRQCKKLNDPVHNKRYLHAGGGPQKISEEKSAEEGGKKEGGKKEEELKKSVRVVVEVRDEKITQEKSGSNESAGGGVTPVTGVVQVKESEG